ncbi:MAG TPA: sugar transferase [Bacteroidales bacterium]|nr:sugar transferase [Bacteroidales bacterium]
MNRRWQVSKYVFFDSIGVICAWFLFVTYRSKLTQGVAIVQFAPESPVKFFIRLALFACFWLILFSLAGFYNDVFRRSRIKELGSSIGITLTGTLIVFFVLLYHDLNQPSAYYFRLFYYLFFLVFSFTYITRLIITSITIHKIHSRKYGYPTLIIGEGEKALELYNELQAQVKSQGYMILGYIEYSANGSNYLEGILPRLGDAKSIAKVINDNKIEEVLIAVENTDNKSMLKLINELLAIEIIIKAIPSLYDYLTGRVKMSEIFSAPLFRVSFELMPPWQVKVKQFMDITIALISLIVLLPLIIVIAVLIKVSSKGPIIHRQERIGQYGKPFMLYKFRSMFVDAESSGPALSSKADSRVTRLGRFMRKTRIDEIPNFVNVIFGEMSLVGPRPERQFYVDQIVKIAPHYVHLQKVKPGITSWGQVKFGYAENVEQMVERLKYDLLYIDNMSIIVDLKIIIYTLITVFKGKGV